MGSLWVRLSELPEVIPPRDYRFSVFANHFYLFSVVTHGLFVPFFALLGVYGLALYNVASVAVYTVALQRNLRGHLQSAFQLMLAEVLVHTILCAYWLGSTVLSHVPLLLGLLVYLATFERCWLRAAQAAAIALVYAGVNYYALAFPPAVSLAPGALNALNLTMGSGGVLAACYMGYYYGGAATRAEGALRRRSAELEARNEDLDAFSHTVAHDLKGPLSEILAFAELLETYGSEMPAAELRAHLHTIVLSGHKMRSIIDELLLLASVRQAGQRQLAALHMGASVAEALLRLAYLIEEQGAEIVLPAAWPPAYGHGPWVEEVWVNYLSNALRYGGRPPRVELGAAVQPDGMVRFWVRDNGSGLTAEEQARLFAPFTRLGKGSITGHGLGLSIVRRIVEKMGGQVAVESEVGRGSVFSFTLSQKRPDGTGGPPQAR